MNFNEFNRNKHNISLNKNNNITSYGNGSIKNHNNMSNDIFINESTKSTLVNNDLNDKNKILSCITEKVKKKNIYGYQNNNMESQYSYIYEDNWIILKYKENKEIISDIKNFLNFNYNEDINEMNKLTLRNIPGHSLISIVYRNAIFFLNSNNFEIYKDFFFELEYQPTDYQINYSPKFINDLFSEIDIKYYYHLIYYNEKKINIVLFCFKNNSKFEKLTCEISMDIKNIDYLFTDIYGRIFFRYKNKSSINMINYNNTFLGKIKNYMNDNNMNKETINLKVVSSKMAKSTNIIKYLNFSYLKKKIKIREIIKIDISKNLLFHFLEYNEKFLNDNYKQIINVYYLGNNKNFYKIKKITLSDLKIEYTLNKQSFKNVLRYENSDFFNNFIISSIDISDDYSYDLEVLLENGLQLFIKISDNNDELEEIIINNEYIVINDKKYLDSFSFSNMSYFPMYSFKGLNNNNFLNILSNNNNIKLINRNHVFKMDNLIFYQITNDLNLNKNYFSILYKDENMVNDEVINNKTNSYFKSKLFNLENGNIYYNNIIKKYQQECNNINFLDFDRLANPSNNSLVYINYNKNYFKNSLKNDYFNNYLYLQNDYYILDLNEQFIRIKYLSNFELFFCYLYFQFIIINNNYEFMYNDFFTFISNFGFEEILSFIIELNIRQNKEIYINTKIYMDFIYNYKNYFKKGSVDDKNEHFILNYKKNNNFMIFIYDFLIIFENIKDNNGTNIFESSILNYLSKILKPIFNNPIFYKNNKIIISNFNIKEIIWIINKLEIYLLFIINYINKNKSNSVNNKNINFKETINNLIFSTFKNDIHSDINNTNIDSFLKTNIKFINECLYLLRVLWFITDNLKILNYNFEIIDKGDFILLNNTFEMFMKNYTESENSWNFFICFIILNSDNENIFDLGKVEYKNLLSEIDKEFCKNYSLLNDFQKKYFNEETGEMMILSKSDENSYKYIKQFFKDNIDILTFEKIKLVTSKFIKLKKMDDLFDLLIKKYISIDKLKLNSNYENTLLSKITNLFLNLFNDLKNLNNVKEDKYKTLITKLYNQFLNKKKCTYKEIFTNSYTDIEKSIIWENFIKKLLSSNNNNLIKIGLNIGLSNDIIKNINIVDPKVFNLFESEIDNYLKNYKHLEYFINNFICLFNNKKINNINIILKILIKIDLNKVEMPIFSKIYLSNFIQDNIKYIGEEINLDKLISQSKVIHNKIKITDYCIKLYLSYYKLKLDKYPLNRIITSEILLDDINLGHYMNQNNINVNILNKINDFYMNHYDIKEIINNKLIDEDWNWIIEIMNVEITKENFFIEDYSSILYNIKKSISKELLINSLLFFKNNLDKWKEIISEEIYFFEIMAENDYNYNDFIENFCKPDNGNSLSNEKIHKYIWIPFFLMDNRFFKIEELLIIYDEEKIIKKSNNVEIEKKWISKFNMI